MFARAKRSSGCLNCHFCDYFVGCSKRRGNHCLGCGICLKGCPAGARSLIFYDEPRPSLDIIIDGEHYSVPARITIGQALELMGKGTRTFYECRVGGCYNCAVLTGNNLLRSCCTEIQDGMEIVTDREAIDRHPPLRLVSLLPHHLYTSVFVFTYGCNFNCDFCHNWESTFASIGKPMTPQEASLVIGQFIGSSEKPRIGISGGEPTLNRRWLVGLLKELRAKKHGIRIQVDTNASLLTRDVIDELYEAGMTDISPDLKGLELDTFIKITGVDNEELAQRYLQTAWQSIEHIVTEYAGKLYYTVGIPYHPDLISKEEVYHMGKKLAGLDQNIDVNLIVYQPAFRARDLQEVAGASIDEAMGLLNNTGLKRVWCQEGQDIPSATDPDDLMLLGESMAVFHF